MLLLLLEPCSRAPDISVSVKLRIRKYAGGAALLTFEQFCLLMEFLKDTHPVIGHYIYIYLYNFYIYIYID